MDNQSELKGDNMAPKKKPGDSVYVLLSRPQIDALQKRGINFPWSSSAMTMKVDSINPKTGNYVLKPPHTAMDKNIYELPIDIIDELPER